MDSPLALAFQWLAAQEIQVRAALIGSLATVVAAVLGAAVVVWQIGRQNKAALAQAQHNEVLRIKVRLYDEITEASWAATQALANVSQFVMSLDLDLAVAEMHPQRVPRARANQLHSAFRAVDESHIAFLRIIERWTVIDPRIRVFQHAFNSARHDFSQATRSYHDIVILRIPIERLDAPGQIMPWAPPNEEILKQIKDLGAAVSATSWNYMTYTGDFEKEMQNALLSELFGGNRVDLRRPIDKNAVVVTLEKHKALSKHFLNETAWGASRLEAEAAARAR